MGAGIATFFVLRDELALCAKLLKLSASTLTDNPGLVAFVVLSQVHAVLASYCD